MVIPHGDLKVVTKNGAIFLNYRDKIYLAGGCNINTRTLEELCAMLEDNEMLTIYTGSVRTRALFTKKFGKDSLGIKLAVINEETLELARKLLKKLKKETNIKNGVINL